MSFARGLGLLVTTLVLAACTPRAQSTGVGKKTSNLSIGPVLGGPETDSFARFTQDYSFRRAFGSSQIPRYQRAAAMTALADMRANLKVEEFDPASDTCNGSCVAPNGCLAGYCAAQCNQITNACPSGTIPRRTIEHCFCVPPESVGTPVTATGCGWTPIGPANIAGRVNALVFDPKDAKRLFAGGVGGLWRSGDKGRRWERVVVGTSGSPPSVSSRIRSLEFNATTGELFVGTGDFHFGGDGIWLSSSGASGSFSRITDSQFDNVVIQRIRAVPGAGGSVYAATDKGVFVGTRSAGAWSWSVLGGMVSNTTDLVAYFGASLLFATVVDPNQVSGRATGVYRFNGQAWEAPSLSPGPTITGMSIAIGGLSPNTLYAKVANNVTTTIYKSTTGGLPPQGGTNAWTALPSTTIFTGGEVGPIDGAQADYNSVIEVDPVDANVVYVGSTALYMSSDGGSTWQWISQHGFEFLHPDVHAVALEPAVNLGSKHIVYAGTDGGVFVSGDLTNPNWIWYQRTHGMQNTEFYRIAAQNGLASIFGGGLQDGGTAITGGARNWFGPHACDGSLIAFDATNASAFGQCNDHVYQLRDRYPYTTQGGIDLSTVVAVDPSQNVEVATGYIGLPVRAVTDPTLSRVSLFEGVDKTDKSKQVVLKSTDGRLWNRLSLDLPPGQKITAMAIAPGTASAKPYYVATQDTNASESQAAIYASSNSGASWAAPVFVPAAWVAGLAIDPGNASRPAAQRAWMVGGGGGLFETNDKGASWHGVPLQSEGLALPTAISITGIAVDGTGNGTLFLSTDVGVMRGDFDGSGRIGWATYSNGLPDGVDVNDIAFNTQGSSLVIGTFGSGAYRRDPKATTCTDSKLIVRDTAYDVGQSPTLNDLPDPEWVIPFQPDPVPVGQTPPTPFFKADDRDGERVYFFESPDIRIGVPSQRDPAKAACPSALQQSCAVDSVEFDSWPIQVGLVGSTPFAQLVDLQPQAGIPATVHVQVANIGVARSTNVRVVAIFADASTGVPELPSDFWSASKVLPGGDCSALQTPNASLGGTWRLAGCQMLPSTVAPGVPEVVTLPWTPPATAKAHSCMVAIVDSPADQVTPTLSPKNVELLAQLDRHVAQRNLHIAGTAAEPMTAAPSAAIDTVQVPGSPFSGVVTLNVPNRWNPSGSAKVMFAKGHIGSTSRLAYMLPTGKTAPGLPAACGVTTNSATNVAISLPKGIVTNDVALSANGTIDIADSGVVVLDAAGGGGLVVNAGAGQTTVGAFARVGTVSAIGGVFLRSNSTVTGDVNLDGTFTQQTGSVVQGKVNKGAPLTPADVVSWAVTWPATSLGNIDLQPGQPLTKAPGRYGSVNVKAGATLTFGAGVYYLDSLTLESGSTLALDQSTGPTTLYTRQGVTIRGTVRAVQNMAPDLLLIAFGSADVTVESSLTGSIVAPSARLTLGNNGGTYQGSYYAHDLTIRTNVHIQQKTSAAWSAVPACRALTPSEKTTVTAAGLSPTLYPAAGTSLKQSLPIAFGQTWTLGVRYDVDRGIQGAASRFRVLSLDPQDRVVAGGTYLFRH